MAQISIVYWSGTGNTELMAQKVAEGVREAGQEAVVLSVDLADVSELKKARAFALGCPPWGQNSWRKRRWSLLCVIWKME